MRLLSATGFLHVRKLSFPSPLLALRLSSCNHSRKFSSGSSSSSSSSASSSSSPSPSSSSSDPSSAAPLSTFPTSAAVSPPSPPPFAATKELFDEFSSKYLEKKPFISELAAYTYPSYEIQFPLKEKWDEAAASDSAAAPSLDSASSSSSSFSPASVYQSYSASLYSLGDSAASPSAAVPPSIQSSSSVPPPSPSTAPSSFSASSSSTSFPINRYNRGTEIFANNDLPLNHIDFYGFDYDYTLAGYNSNVGYAIYETAKIFLVKSFFYPEDILSSCFYDEDFPIRGLQFDVRTGYLLKLDQFLKIQAKSVYSGKERVLLEDVLKHYKGINISKEYEERNLKMLSDLFSLPEACLIGDIVQIFQSKNLKFSPEYIYRDVKQAITEAHISLHQKIIKDPHVFLEKNYALGHYLVELRKAGKKIFLLTNSHYEFVNAGMEFMLNEYFDDNKEELDKLQIANWVELFDVAIFSARKPTFWSNEGRFRRLDPKTGRLTFLAVEEFKRGEIYVEGGLAEFNRLLGNPAGSSVLYMGDHVHADLVAPSETAVWKTAAILKEIAHETEVMSTDAFRSKLKEQLEVESLIDFGQRLQDEDSKKKIEALKIKRSALRKELLQLFNTHFGSVFRTTSHRTRFFFEVSRFADIYTSSVSNFLNYPLHFCFYAKRAFFPHEVPYEMITEEEKIERKKKST